LGASQILDYVRETVRVLGRVPTQGEIVAERFFDEAGGRIGVPLIVVHDQLDLIALIADFDATVFVVHPVQPKAVPLTGVSTLAGEFAGFADGGAKVDDLLFVCGRSGRGRLVHRRGGR